MQSIYNMHDILLRIRKIKPKIYMEQENTPKMKKSWKQTKWDEWSSIYQTILQNYNNENNIVLR